MFLLRGGWHRLWMEAHVSTRKEQSCSRMDLGWLRSSLVCRAFLLTVLSVFECPLQLNPDTPQAVWLRKQVFSRQEMVTQHRGICVTVNVA